MARLRQPARRIAATPGKAPEPRGQQKLAPWELGLADPPLATPRERAILELMAADLTRTEIADALGVASSTVGAHVRALRWRTGLHTRPGLVAWAFRRGLLEAPRPRPRRSHVGALRLANWKRALGSPVNHGELKVLVRLADDLEQREVAARLRVPRETVKSRLRRLRRLTGLRTAEGIVAWAFRRGLLE